MDLYEGMQGVNFVTTIIDTLYILKDFKFIKYEPSLDKESWHFEDSTRYNTIKAVIEHTPHYKWELHLELKDKHNDLSKMTISSNDGWRDFASLVLRKQKNNLMWDIKNFTNDPFALEKSEIKNLLTTLMNARKKLYRVRDSEYDELKKIDKIFLKHKSDINSDELMKELENEFERLEYVVFNLHKLFRLDRALQLQNYMGMELN